METGINCKKSVSNVKGISEKIFLKLFLLNIFLLS